MTKKRLVLKRETLRQLRSNEMYGHEGATGTSALSFVAVQVIKMMTEVVVTMAASCMSDKCGPGNPTSMLDPKPGGTAQTRWI